MKNVVALLVIFFVFFVNTNLSFAQTYTTTIILLRHAEKETTGSDPGLSPGGIERSYKLQKALSNYQPDIFYSTNYKRTKQTIIPWATATNKEIDIYSGEELTVFAEKLKTLKGKTIVVVGHSNTTPQLVNFLLGKERYSALDDAVYNKIWIISIQDNSVTDRIIEY